MSNYIMFTKPRYCPNALPSGTAEPFVKIGDLIRFRGCIDAANDAFGRVLCLARQDGTGRTFRNNRGTPTPHLLVLELGDGWTFGYARFVGLELVREVLQPSAFLRWFCFGTMPPPERVVAALQYAALSGNCIERYLTSPDGELRDDWEHIARHGRK